MIDKLGITSGDIDSKALFTAFGGEKAINQYNQHYDHVEVVQDHEGAHLYTLNSQPRKPGANPFKLELNPTKLNMSYIEMLKILDQCLDIEAGKLQRLDLAVDYPISVKEAHESIRIKHKQNVTAFYDYRSGGLTGYYVGGKFDAYCIYNKNYEQRTKSFIPKKLIRTKGAHPFVLTRFEQRLRYTKIPVQKLSELPFLLTYNPFQNFQAMKLKDGLKDGYERFKSENSCHGLQNTYRSMNKHNNFKRTYSSDFREIDLPEKLLHNYREKLGQFFTGANGEV